MIVSELVQALYVTGRTAAALALERFSPGTPVKGADGEPPPMALFDEPWVAEMLDDVLIVVPDVGPMKE